MQTLAQDLRYALRNLRQAPAFAALVVLTLALGIGANSAIFSVVNGVVLKPLDYREPDDLVYISSNFPGESYGAQFWLSAPEYLQYRERAESFADMGAYATGEVTLNGADTPIRVPAAIATASLFTTLGVEPARGRLFTPEEDLPGGSPAFLISYELWQSAFGGRDDVVGETLLLNGSPSTLVGVMPPHFDVDDNGVQVWSPLQLDPENPGSPFSHYLFAIGRLRDGVTPQQARAETDVLVASWQETYPDSHIRPDGHEVQFEPLATQVVGDVRPALLTLLGAVGFVLLIACANVANLLLARAESRQREIGVRTALGAGRGRLLRQFITESTLMAVLGGAVGLIAGRWAVGMLLAANAGSIPRLAEIGLDGSVLVFTLAISLLTGVLFGLAPLLHLTSANVTAALRESRSTAGSARHRLRRLLVVAEIALAVVLVVGAGLMLRSFAALQNVDPGFDSSGLLTFRLYLPTSSYASPVDQMTFYRELEARLLEIPGAESVTMMTGLPPVRRLNANTMQFEGVAMGDEEGPPSEVDYFQFVMGNYLSTMKIPLLEGRMLTASDSQAEAPVVVVNKAMADMYWPDGAVGRRLRQGSNAPWMTVVGVVGDVKNGGMAQEAGTELYFFAPQAAAMGFGQPSMNVVLRTSIEPTSLSEPARRAVWSLDPSLPLTNLQTMGDAVFGSMARSRFLTVLLGVFGGLALALAAVGTYGVMSYFVAERRREMGIRIALGAESGGVLRLVLAQSLKIAGLGLALGIGASLLLSRFVESWLYGISALDITTFVAVPAVLALVAVAACLVPALRATRVDPVVVLKSE